MSKRPMKRDWTEILNQYPAELAGMVESPNEPFRKLLERFEPLTRIELEALHDRFHKLADEAHEESNVEQFGTDPWKRAAAYEDPHSDLNRTAHDAASVCYQIVIATRFVLESKDLSYNVSLTGCLNEAPLQSAKIGKGLLRDFNRGTSFQDGNWPISALIGGIAEKRGTSPNSVWKHFKTAGYQVGGDEKEEHIIELINFTCRAARYVGKYSLIEPHSPGASISLTTASASTPTG